MFENASGLGYEGHRVSKGSNSKTPSDPVDVVTAEEEVDFFKERGNNNIFLETSKEMDERIRANSPFKHLRTWRLMKVIVKSNDDVRQEQFAMQLIS
jgi:phosphatidylinositol kinase/protein kinase (PI-3  family)